MPDPREIQRARNLETRDSKSAFASHATHVMRHIMACQRSRKDRLCILGAGNCNDVQLDDLSASFGEVHLVDVDSTALHAAHANQFPNVITHTTDLSGWYDRVGDGDDKNAACEIVSDACLMHQPEIPGQPFDGVVSTCLISQIIDSAVACIGHDHPRLNELVFTIRHQHLATLLNLLVPGGRGVLITDFVSSDTFPSLNEIPSEQFANQMAVAVNAGNFFTGLNPAAILNLLQTDTTFSATAVHRQLSLPWHWNLGKRGYGVAAVSFARAK